MQEERKISFGAQDTGIGSFIKKMQADTKAMFADYMKEAQKQTANAKEQLRIVEQQIKALREQNKLEQEQSRIILERRRSTGQVSDRQYTSALSQIREDGSINKYQTLVLKELLDHLKGQQPDEQSPRQGSIAGQVFLGTMMAEGVRMAIRGMNTAVSSRNEFDILSAFNPWGVPIGAPYARHLTSREEYFKAEYGVQGLTGRGGQTGRMSDIGMDLIESTRFEESLIRSIGRATTADEIRRTAVMMKAYSVDQGTALQYAGLQRMGGAGLSGTKILEDALRRGLDRSLTSDYLKNVVQLTTTMAQTSLTGNQEWDQNRATQMLLEFNKIGGPFAIRDPRSAGLISGIQQDIANPQSAFAQALSYAALRQTSPDKSFVDLMIERQKGGTGLLGQQLSILSQSGLSEDLLTMMMPTIAPSLRGNLAASRQLVRGRGVLGSLAGETLGADTDYQGIDQRAQALTSRIEQGTAEVTDAFIEGMTSGMLTLKDRFVDLMGLSFDEIADQAKKKFIDMFISIDSSMPSGGTYYPSRDYRSAQKKTN